MKKEDVPKFKILLIGPSGKAVPIIKESGRHLFY